MTSHIDILEGIIENRRTVKPSEFSGEKIDDALIEKILSSANWAPTHGYTEPWRFTVFAEDGLASLGDFYSKLDQPNPDAEDFNEMRFNKLRNRALCCSHVIGIGMKRGNNPKVPEIEELASVAMAVQNIWLSAHAYGLSGYWSTGSLAFRDEMRDFFGLEEGDKSLGLFYLGKSASPHPKGRRISPIEEKTRWIKS
mgnify:CR=1 FL=1